MTTVSKSMRRVSERREYMELPGDDGAVGFISVWVDGVQVAAGIRQDPAYAERNGGRGWSLWSSGLSLRTTGDAPVTSAHAPQQPRNTHPIPVDDEHDVCAWLALIADLAENGPSVVESRRRR